MNSGDNDLLFTHLSQKISTICPRSAMLNSIAVVNNSPGKYFFMPKPSARVE